MRRISIGMMLLFLVPSITQAYHYGSSLRYRVQFSPYAFGYHSNGLVPGGLAYTPYAFSPGRSGLVFEDVRYIPYAFNYKNPGLVLDYYWYPIPYAVYSASPSEEAYPRQNQDQVRPSNRREDQPKDMRFRSRPYRYPSDQLVSAPAGRPAAAVAKEDTLTIIRQYLRERGLLDVGVNRILRINNQLVSADFTVGGQNLLIKYWDPTQLELANAKADSARRSTDSLDSKMIEKYKKDWESFAGRYQQEGGEIYVVTASSRTDIVVALNTCNKLGPSEAKPSPQVMYAKR
jgi:hypothetical protein